MTGLYKAPAVLMPDRYSKGTLQFMALALLEAIQRKQALEHTPGHDLESIIYVLGYTVLRRVVSSAGCPETLNDFFKECFGQETVGNIATQRETCKPLTWWYKHNDRHVKKYASGIMGGLFRGLVKLLRAVHGEIEEDFYQASLDKDLLALGQVRERVTHAGLSLTRVLVVRLRPCCPTSTHPYS